MAQQGTRLTPWFDDGNVVLAVEGKYFRVHRGVLALYSEIFKDMFSCPQPQERKDQEMIEGCPVVTLHDKIQAVQIILRACYSRSYINNHAMPLSVTAAFLRLGKKYLISQLFNEARDSVENSYPTTLMKAQWTPFLVHLGVSGQDKHHFHMINLAREVGMLSVLPVMFAFCCRACPLEYIVEGYEVCGSRVELTLENKNACILGREKLPELYLETFSWLKTRREASECTDRNRCAAGIEATRAEVWSPERLMGGTGHDPFVTWEMRWESRLCPKCLKYCKREHQRGRDNAWAQLPAVFGLGSSWEELKKNETTV
ncbi:hypothetical protein BU15DRAFT_75612 [Melanogaster broomeanus]|nr:hypothetical protein BU15DRAFT_75612 [Melanogaster broomeanus]